MRNHVANSAIAPSSPVSSAASARSSWLWAGFSLVLLFAATPSYGGYPPQGVAADELAHGVALYRGHQLSAAIPHLERAIQGDPQAVNGWLYLGAAYAVQLVPHAPSQQNSPACIQAREAFQQVLKIDPVNKVALAGLGAIAFWVNDPAQAREFQLKRWELDPTDPRGAVWVVLLDFLMCFPRDLQLRQRLGITDSNQPLPESARAQLEAQNGKLVEEGMKLLPRVLDLQPSNLDATILSSTMYRQKAELERDSGARANDLQSAARFAADAQAAGGATVGEPVSTGTEKDFAPFLTPPPLPLPPPPHAPAATVPFATLTPQSPKPFTQEQVKAMVRDGLANDLAAKAIATQGVDFTPTDGLLRVLQAAGASETFLAALRNAPHPAAPRLVETPVPSTNPPIDHFQLLSLLAAGLREQRIIDLVQQRGVTRILHTQVTDSQSPYLGWFQGLGASDELIATLRSANTFPDPDVAALPLLPLPLLLLLLLSLPLLSLSLLLWPLLPLSLLPLSLLPLSLLLLPLLLPPSPSQRAFPGEPITARLATEFAIIPHFTRKIPRR